VQWPWLRQRCPVLQQRRADHRDQPERLLDLFDTNLGTLNSVTLTLNGSMTTTIDLSNSAAQSQTARGTGTVDLTFASLAGLDLSSVLMNLTATTGFQSLLPAPAPPSAR
jgi:hypothetical protein